MYHISLTQSSIDGQLGHFHLSAATSVDGSDCFVFLLSSSLPLYCQRGPVGRACHFSSICNLLQGAVKQFPAVAHEALHNALFPTPPHTQLLTIPQACSPGPAPVVSCFGICLFFLHVSVLTTPLLVRMHSFCISPRQVLPVSFGFPDFPR